MWEENKKKINLSWLKISSQETDSTEKNVEVLDVPEIVEEIEEEKIEKKSNKISLAWMKQKREWPKNSPQKTEQEDKQEVQDIKTESANNQSDGTTLSLDKEKVEIVLETEDEKDSNSSDDSEEKENWDKQEDSQEEKTSLFSNYTSDFEKEEWTIIEKLKELGKKPQTRVVLVVVLILSTILWIAALFFVDPKRHSISHYKAVLMWAYNKYTGNNTVVEKNKDLKVKAEKKQEWKKDSLVRNGYKITIETKISESGVKIYKFNNWEFNTISKLNTEIDIEIKKLKSWKVKDFLLKAKIKKQEKEIKKAKVDTPSDSDTTKNKSNLDLLKNR